MREISAHRIIQLSILSDNLGAKSAQLLGGANNAKRIGAMKYWRDALTRVRRIRRIERKLHAILRRAEWQRMSEACSAKVECDLLPRPVNGLNVEMMTPLNRCIEKQPRNWFGRNLSSIRWLASGGDHLVFGACTPNCPRMANDL